MQEAQLIRRGAIYIPFAEPTGKLPVGARKYDKDTTNRLRVLETLHYHSVNNPKYINELRTVMVQTSIVAENVRTVELKLKDSFKKTALYKTRYVFTNGLESYKLNETVTSLGEAILNKEYKIRIKSGDMSTSSVFEAGSVSNTMSVPYRAFKLHKLGCHVLRSTINRFESFKFSNLNEIYPNLFSVKEFLENSLYLAGINIQIYTKQEVLDNLIQKDKLFGAIKVLKQIEPLLSKGGIGYKGTKRFQPKHIKEIFREKTQKIYWTILRIKSSVSQ